MILSIRILELVKGWENRGGDYEQKTVQKWTYIHGMGESRRV